MNPANDLDHEFALQDLEGLVVLFVGVYRWPFHNGIEFEIEDERAAVEPGADAGDRFTFAGYERFAAAHGHFSRADARLLAALGRFKVWSFSSVICTSHCTWRIDSACE